MNKTTTTSVISVMTSHLERGNRHQEKRCEKIVKKKKNSIKQQWRKLQIQKPVRQTTTLANRESKKPGKYKVDNAKLKINNKIYRLSKEQISVF